MSCFITVFTIFSGNTMKFSTYITCKICMFYHWRKYSFVIHLSSVLVQVQWSCWKVKLSSGIIITRPRVHITTYITFYTKPVKCNVSLDTDTRCDVTVRTMYICCFVENDDEAFFLCFLSSFYALHWASLVEQWIGIILMNFLDQIFIFFFITWGRRNTIL